MNDTNSLKSFLRFFKFARKWRCKIYLATTYSVINKLFDIAPEILLGIAVDVVTSSDNNFLNLFGIHDSKDQVITLAILTFGIWAFESIFQYLYMVGWRNIAQSIEHDVRRDLYSNVQSLDIRWHENQKLGNITSIINDDVNQLERFINNGINQIVQIIVSTVLIGGVFFLISPLIATIILIPIPIIFFISMFFQKNLSPKYLDVRKSVGDLNSSIFNNLLGIITIKSFASEDKEIDKIEALSHKYLDKNKGAIRLSSAFVPIVRMGVLSGFLATMVLGSLMALNKEISAGEFAMLLFLTQRFLWPFTSLGEIVDLFERSMASTKRILDTIDFIPTIKDGQEGGFLKFDQSISFNSVNFYYNKKNTIFDSISFSVEKNKITAIVGPTGAGKTSLVKLLLRFYDPQLGEILIGNENIKNLKLNQLRKNIGLVGQDTFLFDGTIKDNIIYPSEKADIENMKRAAILSQSIEFIESFDKDFETMIGERGVKLSGGQKQRLAIARALYKNPPILVFDEATSSIDNHTESLIQKSMKDICKNRTALVIAHRLSTIRYADKIIVIDDGKVAEQGNHEDLILEEGLYKKLWDIQTGVVLD
ncbi:MAG: ABC transporter [Candidatus Marinimicrobia bacterium]|nr:ABC transporter [Candidatus Neomarinimicrobiota bacterium]